MKRVFVVVAGGWRDSGVVAYVKLGDLGLGISCVV